MGCRAAARRVRNPLRYHLVPGFEGPVGAGAAQFLLALASEDADHAAVAKKTRRRAATKSTAPARARNESSRQRFLLSPEELGRRLALLDQVDELKAKSEKEQGYGYFLKALREKFQGESVEGLRQLRVSRDRLGLRRFRRLVRRLGFKRTLVLATLPDDQRENLIEHGLAVGKGVSKNVDELSLRELEDLARRWRKRSADRHPGPPVPWPDGLLRLLRPLIRALPRVEVSRRKVVGASSQRGKGQLGGARTKAELLQALGSLERVVLLVTQAIEDIGPAKKAARRTRRTPRK